MSESGLSVIASLFASASAVFGTGPYGSMDLPDVSAMDIVAPPNPAWVVNVKDEVIGNATFYSGDQSGSALGEYPETFLSAVLAAEDARFFEHGGADPIGTLSAIKDTLTGRTRGGSSLTQQLVKNEVVGNDQTLSRKVQELILSLRLETQTTKPEILAAYLNHAWFGRGAQGATHASRVWFGKPWSETTLAEQAALAGMLKGPGYYDPEKHPERVKGRRDEILSRMSELGLITETEEASAKAEELRVTSRPDESSRDIWVMNALRHEAEVYAKAQGGGEHSLNGTFSLPWQTLSQKAVSAARVPDGAQAAMVVMSMSTGELIATVGGRDPETSGYDRTFARRQPGSLGKPLFYAAALDMGMTPWDLVSNDRIRWGDGWDPKNYDGSETAPAPMYQGLEASSNLMTVHLTDYVPMETLFRTAELSGAWGIGEIRNVAPSLLGATETNLRNITSGLAGLANGGRTLPIKAFDEENPTSVTFVSPSSAGYVSSMMRGVMMRGTARVANRKTKVPLIGKTGTSQNHRDAWFVGMTSDVVVGVWVGRDDDKTLGAGRTGSELAGAIATDTLNAALEEGLIDDAGRLTNGEGREVPWPPEVIDPTRSAGQETYVYIDQGSVVNPMTEAPARPGDEQVEAFMEQLDQGIWR